MVPYVAIVFGIGGTGATYAYGNLLHDSAALENQLTMHLERGQAELEAAKANLAQANASRDDKLIPQAKVHFITAKLEFMTAAQIADSSGLLKQLETVPSIGESVRSRHTAVDAISTMGVDLSLAGGDLADLDQQLIAPVGSGQQGTTLLTMVNQVDTRIGPVRLELVAALKAAERVDLAILSAAQQTTLVRAQGTIRNALAALDQLKALLPMMTEVLGGNGARTYLIEQVNPAELRPGGGFIGTYSVLRADHGTLQLIRSGDAVDLILPRAAVGQAGYVQPPGPIRELIPNTSWSFIDSNFFPDFPSNAKAGVSFAESHLGMHIDAVVAIDYYTVAAMLATTGPIAVPGYGITLTSQNIVPTIVQYDLQTFTSAAAVAIHKAILAAVAGPLLQRIVSLQPSQWPALLGTLNSLAATRDLQVYFNNADVEKAMTEYGWAGTQKPSAAPDYMMEVEANLGGTKANYFVTRHYTVELTRSGNTLHHKISVAILDSMPYLYRPNEYYRAYIRMFIGASASAASDNLILPKYGSPAAPAGMSQLDGWVTMPGYGNNRIAVFQWDTPWQPNGRGQEQVYWQKQPGTQSDIVDIVWNDGNGHTYKVSGDLGRDRVITLAPTGVTLLQGQVGTAQLPSLSLG